MAKQQKQRWTMALKVRDVLAAGVGREVMPTLSQFITDYSANDSGEVEIEYGWMAHVLGICERTVRRHVEALVEAGLVARIHRTRDRTGPAWGVGTSGGPYCPHRRREGAGTSRKAARATRRGAVRSPVGAPPDMGVLVAHIRDLDIYPPLWSPPKDDQYASSAREALATLSSWAGVKS